MNQQDIFDQVVTHLFRQGRQSMNGDICAYRGENNTSCAAGCLIRDDEYDPAMDDLDEIRKRAIEKGMKNSIFSTTVTSLHAVGLLPERLHDSIELLSALQSVHDSTYCIDHGSHFDRHVLRLNLIEVAKDFDLDPKAIPAD